MKILSHLVLGLLVASISGYSAPSKINVNVDGVNYQCGPGASSTATSLQCIKGITEYCREATSLNSEQCHNKAHIFCKGAPEGYPECVKDSTDYCVSKTSKTKAQCFEQSLNVCYGNFRAIQDLIDAVK